MPNYDFKYQVGGVLRGGPEILVDPGSSGTSGWFGSKLVNSATAGAFYPISTTRVASDSMFHLGLRFVGGTPSSFGAAPAFAVTSLVAGVGFVLHCVGSTAATSFFIDWQLLNPVTHG
jgi:hypothetical protein